MLVANPAGYDRGNQPAFNCRFVLGFALPDDKDAPAQLLQRRLLASVAVDVGREFLLPESDPGLGVRRKSASFVPMPKAPVYEHGESVFREHQVWTPRKILPVNAEAQTDPVGDPTYG